MRKLHRLQLVAEQVQQEAGQAGEVLQCFADEEVDLGKVVAETSDDKNVEDDDVIT